jgi:hypothetical protein
MIFVTIGTVVFLLALLAVEFSSWDTADQDVASPRESGDGQAAS